MCIPLDIPIVRTIALKEFNDDVGLEIQMTTTFYHTQQAYDAARIESLHESRNEGKENLFIIATDMDLDIDVVGGEGRYGGNKAYMNG